MGPIIERRDVDEMRAACEAVLAGKSQQVTRLGAIKLLAPVIDKMMKEGYSGDFIAEVLSKKGLRLRASTLRAYMKQARAEKKSASKPGRMAPKGDGRGAPAQASGAEGGKRNVADPSGQRPSSSPPPPSKSISASISASPHSMAGEHERSAASRPAGGPAGGQGEERF